jgi:hypothetical protein
MSPGPHRLFLFALSPESGMAPIAEYRLPVRRINALRMSSCAFGYAEKCSGSTEGKLEQTILQAAQKRGGPIA